MFNFSKSRHQSIKRFSQKLIILTTIFILSIFFTCSAPKKKMYVVVNFDVEDYVTPGSEGIDDIPKWLAEIMTEEGVTGTFFVIGEKARSLEQRGRFDVIEAMAKHDIGSHTNQGSIHPTVTEQLEKADWENGSRLMFEQESAGFRELERIFGTPVAILARHGGSYGPQLISALAQLNAGYTGSPVSLPDHDVVWFCNALNFSAQYGGFDDSYFKDDLFQPIFDSLKVRFPKLIPKVDVISVFAGHPCKIQTKQFWDLNYYYGANVDSSNWKIPDRRPQESMKTAQNNFRRLMKFFKNQKGVEITTFRNLMNLYGNQKQFLTKSELNRIAEKTINSKSILFDDHFSPAEIFNGLVKSIIEYRNNGSLPQKTDRISPFGPIEMPDTEPQISTVNIEDVYKLAREADNYISSKNSLPTFLKVGNFQIGTGSLYALFSAVYLNMNSNNPAGEYSISSFDSYPQTYAKEIISRIKGYKTWPVHRTDLDMTHLIEMTKLQLWTLKPAHIM